MSAAALAFLFWLIYFRGEAAAAPAWTAWLPEVNATLNATSAALLLSGIAAIRSGDRERHMKRMLAAFVVSSAFLVSYIIYHHFQGDTPFEGRGVVRPIYFFILISHIVVSVAALPLVLTTLYLAATKRFDRHRRVARYTAPMWLYVSVTGVLVYAFLKLFG